MLPDYFEFFVSTRITAGPGIISSLGQDLDRRGWRRCFIVTDRTLTEAGLLDRLLAGLEGSGVTVAGTYDGVTPNSEVGQVEEAAAMAREAGTDVLIALGGGSNIDTAKALNIVLTNGGSLLDYEGFGLLESPLTPLVAIPTTAGTGSEVTQFAVIKSQERKAKLSFLSPYLLPDLAVLDPELTTGLPAGLTASTGLDALTHAVEAHLSTDANPVASGLALQAASMIFKHLPAAVADGHNLQARYAMQVASTMAGMAFSSSMVGVVHAMAHACGGLCDVPHGLANAILLPHGMEYNLATSTPQLGDLARAAGVPNPGLDPQEYALLGIKAVQDLIASCGLPQNLAKAGVLEASLSSLAELAAVDGAVFTNPNPAGPEEIAEILKKAY